MDHPSSPVCPSCGTFLAQASVDGLCAKCLGARNFAIETDPQGEFAAAMPPATPAEIAEHFPQLEILELLGRGGMGVVYKARQKSLNRMVALKLLAPERVTDARFAERFTHEAHALAALNHPNIVTIHDFGQAGGFYFLLMEFVDGVNLRQAMKAGRFAPEQALAVVPPVCEALQYAHEQGIVHRDIKPENLLLDKKGHVKIADFGIAKILGAPAPAHGEAESRETEASFPAAASPGDPTFASLAGTPQYMAPEQRANLRVDHRVDIYALGVVLYELLTGELPADKLQPPSRKVQLDVRLDEIVLRALEARPELRYQTAGEFRTQVVTMTRGVSAPPVEPSIPAGSSRFSRTAIVGACWIAAFLLMVMTWVSIMGEHSVRPAVPWYVFDPGGPLRWWVNLLVLILFPLGITAPFGTSLLGWTAVTQIRHSAGKLHGLWLAVFDGLLFLVLAVDALLGFVWYHVVDGVFQALPPVWKTLHADVQRGLFSSAFVGLTILSAAVADLLIVRAVWRTVVDASVHSALHYPPEKAGGLAWSLRPTAIAVILLFVAVAFSAPLFPERHSAVAPPAAPSAPSIPPAELQPTREGTDLKLSISAEHEAFIKSAPATADQRAALFEQDVNSAGSSHLRPGIRRYPIFRGMKPPPRDAIPAGEVLYLPDGSTYYQLDEVDASTLHYYGPFYPDSAAKFGLSLFPAHKPTPPVLEAGFRFYEMPDDARADLTRLDSTTLRQSPGVKLLFAPRVTMFSGSEAEIGESADGQKESSAPAPAGATAWVKVTLSGETVHYEMKLTLRVQTTSDDPRRSTVQELSHHGDALLDQPLIVDLGMGGPGRRLLGQVLFRRGPDAPQPGGVPPSPAAPIPSLSHKESTPQP